MSTQKRRPLAVNDWVRIRSLFEDFDREPPTQTILGIVRIIQPSGDRGRNSIGVQIVSPRRFKGHSLGDRLHGSYSQTGWYFPRSRVQRLFRRPTSYKGTVRP